MTRHLLHAARCCDSHRVAPWRTLAQEPSEHATGAVEDELDPAALEQYHDEQYHEEYEVEPADDAEAAAADAVAEEEEARGHEQIYEEVQVCPDICYCSPNGWLWSVLPGCQRRCQFGQLSAPVVDASLVVCVSVGNAVLEEMRSANGSLS